MIMKLYISPMLTVLCVAEEDLIRTSPLSVGEGQDEIKVSFDRFTK